MLLLNFYWLLVKTEDNWRVIIIVKVINHYDKLLDYLRFRHIMKLRNSLAYSDKSAAGNFYIAYLAYLAYQY
jgi:hypothetical protein